MSYGRKYYLRFRDKGGIAYRIEFLKDGYSGADKEFISAARTCRMRSVNLSKGEHPVVIASELVANVIQPRSDISDIKELASSDYKDWLVRRYSCEPGQDTLSGGTMTWVGYLQPANIKYDITGKYMQVSLSATDALKDLQEMEFTDASGWVFGDQLMSGMEIIKAALVKLGFELDFRVKLNTQETSQSSTALCLSYSFFNAYRFTGEGRGRRPAGYSHVDSCYDVLSRILELFNCTLKQSEGYYVIDALHEKQSYVHVVNWNTLASNRYSISDDVVDVSGKKLAKTPSGTMLDPVKRIDVVHRNRNLGTSPLVDDPNNWYGSWNILYTDTEVIGDRFTINLDEVNDGDGHYMELNNDFTVSVETEHAYYLKLSFGHWLHSISGDISPYFIIGIKKGETWHHSTKNYLSLGSETFTSPNSALYKLPDEIGSHDMNVRILFGCDFNEEEPPPTWSAQWSIRLMSIKKIVVIGEDDEMEVHEDISFDSVWRFVSDLPAKLNKKYEFLFGDTLQLGDIGAIYVGADAGSASNSEYWKRHGKSESERIIYLIGQLKMNNRQAYKEYVTIGVFDFDNDIEPNSIIKIIHGGVTGYYFIESFDRDMNTNLVSMRLAQIIYDDVTLSYSPIPLEMSTIDGIETVGLQVVSGGVTETERNKWNTAYNWGNHSVAGYLKEVDIDRSDWDDAFSWGDHSLAGYLTSETDPVFNAHVASGITQTDIENWDDAFSWGDHSLAGYVDADDVPGDGDVRYYEPNDNYFLDIKDSRSPSNTIFSVDISHTHNVGDINDVYPHKILTKSEYNNIAEKDANTLYFIKED